MTKSAPLGQVLIAHGVDLSGDVGSISEMGNTMETLDVTPISKSSHERLAGLVDGVIAFDSFFNDAITAGVGGAHAALKGMPSGDRVIIWAKGSTVDDAAALLLAKQMNFNMNRGADGSLAQQSTFRSQGQPLEFGTMLTGGVDTHAGATTGSERDDGAATSDGASLALAVLDLTGTSVTFIVEDDDTTGFPSATTLATFTVVNDGSEPTAERITVTGSVERFLRVRSTGTFSDCDFAIFVRRGTTNDYSGQGVGA